MWMRICRHDDGNRRKTPPDCRPIWSSCFRGRPKTRPSHSCRRNRDARKVLPKVPVGRRCRLPGSRIPSGRPAGPGRPATNRKFQTGIFGKVCAGKACPEQPKDGSGHRAPPDPDFPGPRQPSSRSPPLLEQAAPGNDANAVIFSSTDEQKSLGQRSEEPHVPLIQ